MTRLTGAGLSSTNFLYREIGFSLNVAGSSITGKLARDMFNFGFADHDVIVPAKIAGVISKWVAAASLWCPLIFPWVSRLRELDQSSQERDG